jgi:hypothetical protein
MRNRRRFMALIGICIVPVMLAFAGCTNTTQGGSSATTGGTTSGTSATTSTTSTTSSTTTTAQPPTATPKPAPQAQVNFAFNEVAISAGTVVHASVSCPAGTTLLGGGYGINTSQQYLIAADDSYPANATTWTIDTHQAASIALDVHVEAECLQANFATQVQIADNAASADGGSFVATCPAGTVVSGGGYRAANGTSVASEPSGNGWKYINAGLPGGSNYSVTAYAVCVSGAPLAAGTVVQAALAVPSDNGGSNIVTKGTYVNCPGGDLATGGGFDGSAVVDNEGFYIIGSNSGTNGPLQHPQGWGVFAENTSYSNQPAQVYAVCLSY